MIFRLFYVIVLVMFFRICDINGENIWKFKDLPKDVVTKNMQILDGIDSKILRNKKIIEVEDDDYVDGLLVEPEAFFDNNDDDSDDGDDGVVDENNSKNKMDNKSNKKLLINQSKDSIQQPISFMPKIQKIEPKFLPSFFRDLDKSKIQSNTKDIEDDSGQNFVYEKNIIIPPKLPKHYELLEKQYNAEEEKDYEDNAKENYFHKKKKFLRAKLNKKASETMKKKKQKWKNNFSYSKKKGGKFLEARPHFSSPMKRIRRPRAVMPKKERIWDHGIIPYEIDSIFSGSHKAVFKQAMRHWENYTCIKFVEREPKFHTNYIYFTIKNCGCCSFVGKRGTGRQAISIGHNCDKFGIVVHELGHVIGFWHEHTRIDRDKYITINRANILKGQEYNFNVLAPDDVDSLGLPYDYKSIMHYARNTFSKSVYLDTISPIVPKGQVRPDIGQRVRLSQGDVSQANLLYKCPKCGRTYQQSFGKILSPNFVKEKISSSKNEERCEWRITATHGERIILTIRDLKILQSDDCSEDYLEIRDGYWFRSPLIARICGNITVNLSNRISTNSSRMLLIYVNRNVMNGFNGFAADFEVTCGGDLYVGSARRIDSPNYPLEYLSDKECIWRVTVPEGYEVALKFQTFEIENHDNCIYDYVEIRDGDNANAELIGVFCGYKLPPSIKSNSNKMYVKFVSDASVQKVGFSALFMKEVDECKLGKHDCEHECINTLGSYECKCNAGFELEIDGKSCEDACGGLIDAAKNTSFNSPSYPDVYPILKECVWEIIAPENHNVFLNFSHFDLEGARYQFAECNYDYIVVYSKLKDNRLRRIATYCGNEIPPLINSEQNIMRVEFHSDKSVQHTGFVAEILTDLNECATNNAGCQQHCINTYGSYKCSCRNGYTLHENGHNCTETNCKFEITAPYGIISSPNYPNHYPRNTYCYWHFTTIPGHRIQLTFHDFEIENHQECIYDSVAIYDGRNENSSTLGVYCGEKSPYTVFASTNELYMVLRTDTGLQKKGFMATHNTECGGFLHASNHTKHFYSHARFGHRPYKKNMYCIWRIQASPDSSVKLSFVSFSIEYENKCGYDYVEVTEENSHPKKSRHGKFCGSFKPPKIVSYSDTLVIKFESDGSTSLKGFAASYVEIEPPEQDEESNDYDELVTHFSGYHKSFNENSYIRNGNRHRGLIT